MKKIPTPEKWNKIVDQWNKKYEKHKLNAKLAKLKATLKEKHKNKYPIQLKLF